MKKEPISKLNTNSEIELFPQPFTERSPVPKDTDSVRLSRTNTYLGIPSSFENRKRKAAKEKSAICTQNN